MNFINFSVVLALLSFELKVFASPILDNISEGEVKAVETLEAEISEDGFEIYNVDSDLEEAIDSSGSEWENPTEIVNTIDGQETSDLPCDNFYSCVDWFGENKDTLNLFTQPVITDEFLEYLKYQYQNSNVLEQLQQQYDTIHYGIKVDVNGHQMSVNIQGEENDKTIVLLPGLGIMSPVIFYKNITESLATDFKVVTVEPFGYGLSDQVVEARTVENIVSELHTCLGQLGIENFYFMGHSIAGIYSVAYDHTYPREMLGFIGLDNTPSGYDELIDTGYPEIFLTLLSILDKYHMWVLFPEDLKRAAMGIDEELKYQNYSEEDLKNLEIILNYKVNNANILNENKLTKENVAFTKGMRFQCPALMFIASSTQNSLPIWESLHEAMITDTKNSEIIIVDGSHGFIHSENKKLISDKIKEWILKI